MYLPYDPLREAILLELNRAISTGRAQGASFEALGREYGLPKETVYLIAGRDEWLPAKRIAKGGRRSHPKSRLLQRLD